MRVTISPEGDVSKVEAISGHPMLVASAIDAVKQWKYQRYVLNGQPPERKTEAVVDFSLESGEGHAGNAAVPSAATGIVGDAPEGISPGQTNGGIIGSTPAVPAVATPLRVRVSAGVAQALLVRRVSPEYPLQARLGRIQAVVILHVLICKTGDVMTVDLITGHPALAPAAIEAVKQWKYKPYLLNGKPVEVDSQIQISFTLAG